MLSKYYSKLLQQQEELSICHFWFVCMVCVHCHICRQPICQYVAPLLGWIKTNPMWTYWSYYFYNALRAICTCCLEFL